MYCLKGSVCVCFVDVPLSLLGNDGGCGGGGAGEGSIFKQTEILRQHKLEPSNPQESMKLPFSVGYGQERVLWHLDEELGLLANCTLEK